LSWIIFLFDFYCFWFGLYKSPGFKCLLNLFLVFLVNRLVSPGFNFYCSNFAVVNSGVHFGLQKFEVVFGQGFQRGRLVSAAASSAGCNLPELLVDFVYLVLQCANPGCYAAAGVAIGSLSVNFFPEFCKVVNV
jgi:hypothetical protein